MPKAYILLIASAPPSRETAQSILKYTNQRLAPFKRIRRAGIRHRTAQDDLRQDPAGAARRVEYEGSAADVARGVEFHEKDLLA